MARKPRVHYRGALYHVILRGNGGQDIFFDDKDRTRFYFLIQEGIERFGHRIHAFCLMTNHAHLAMQVGETSLSRILQNLSFRYTRWINWRYHRSGHLFQGRYKAVLVDGEAFLLQVTRYLHLNPVRAGMVTEAADYPWSGHRCYLGLEAIGWLTTEWVLGHFSKRLSAARRAYRTFVSEGKGEGQQPQYHKGSDTDSRILGDDTFIEKVLGQKQPMRRKSRVGLDEVMQQVCKRYSIPEEDLRLSGRSRRISEARGVAAWLILESGICRLAELGKVTGRDISTLSSAVNRLQKRAKKELRLAATVKGLFKTIL